MKLNVDLLSKIYRNFKIGTFRTISQFFIALLCLISAFEFSFFVKYLETEGISGWNYRPPLAEGFLPISNLMNLYYFMQTGNIHSYHPAGFFIFIAILLVSLIVGKSFCSWICPIGFLSECLGELGAKIIRKKIKLPASFDFFFRTFKYIILLFFIYAIFSMSLSSLIIFLDSDYNFMADVKMYYFFANISKFSLLVIAILFVMSIIIRNFWCRYFCPYGALLGFVGLISLIKIKRDTTICVDCGKCSKVCPAHIKVTKLNAVISDECNSCSMCIDSCPVKEALEFKLGKIKIKRKVVPVLVFISFWLIIIHAIIANLWHNNQPLEKYIELNKKIETLNHPKTITELKKYETKF